MSHRYGRLEDDPPNEFICPISQSIMIDPVMASDGHTYDRSSIQSWIQTCAQRGQVPRSPVGGVELVPGEMRPNHNLRKLIGDFLDRNPSFQQAPSAPPPPAPKHAFIEAGIVPRDGPPPPTSKGNDAPGQRTAASAASTSAEANVQYNGVPKTFTREDSAKTLRDNDVERLLEGKSGKSAGSSPPGAACSDDEDWAKGAFGRKVSIADGTLLGERILSCALDGHALTSRGVMNVWTQDGGGGWTRGDGCSGSRDEGHRDRTTCTAIAMSGGIPVLATGSRDRTVKIWGEASGGGWRVGATLEGHTDFVSSLSGISGQGGEGALFCSGGRDKTLRLWSASGGKREEGWKCAGVCKGGESGSDGGGHRDFVTSCTMRRLGDGTVHMASGGADWEVLLWDISTPENGPIRTLSGHAYAVRAVAFASARYGNASPGESDPALLASGGDDEKVVVWDARIKAYGSKVARMETGSAVLCCCWGGEGGVGGGGPGWLAAGGGIGLDSMQGTSENVGGWLRVWDVRMWKLIGDCSSVDHNTEQTFHSIGGGGAAARTVPPRTASAAYLTDPGNMCEGEQASRSSKTADGDVGSERAAHSGFVSACCAVGGLGGGSDLLASVGSDKKVRVWGVKAEGAGYGVASGGKGAEGSGWGVSLRAVLSGHETGITSCTALPAAMY